MVGDLTRRLTTDGHNEKAQCQSHYTSLWENTHTNQPLLPCQDSQLHRQPSGRFPFSSAFLFFFFQPEPVKKIGIWYAVTQPLPDLDDRRVHELLWSWCAPSREGEILKLWKIPHWAERQSLGIREGRRKQENSSGERGINLMASQWVLIFM